MGEVPWAGEAGLAGEERRGGRGGRFEEEGGE